MSKHFYRDIKVIAFCKVCRVEYRTPRGSFFSVLRLCHKHRQQYYKKWYQEKLLPWLERQPIEVQKKYRTVNYAAWKNWTIKNIERRRALALASYHKNKNKHKARAHRATQKPNS